MRRAVGTAKNVDNIRQLMLACYFHQVVQRTGNQMQDPPAGGVLWTSIDVGYPAFNSQFVLPYHQLFYHVTYQGINHFHKYLGHPYTIHKCLNVVRMSIF